MYREDVINFITSFEHASAIGWRLRKEITRIDTSPVDGHVPEIYLRKLLYGICHAV
jgi:hypothetical protein